ncbi:monocarboxylate transporter 9-like isoform X2 [Leptopilina boulardi]|uniref:monocarboxylate transporter 9-like isoform X2 n=1 Tax=Leptopilina boulardi TaxID=63433 RepID=UPI0021F514A5|nr:monocarboxylate transporter 9-like isoform X2 [Leptopilina boulardi]
MKTYNFNAPDGGWGWIVVLATALNNMVTIPILQCFAFIFKDRFDTLNFSAIQITTITNWNSFFGMILGIFNGPLITIFGYRKTAILGTLVFTAGVVYTAFASSFLHFMIGYGMITSVGMGIAMSSFFLALNTYFAEKRGRAMGIAMTLTGIGPILIPQVSRFLLHCYGSQGTMLLLGGFSLHALIGAMLLQPVKWHSKKEKIDHGQNLESQYISLLQDICPECTEDEKKQNSKKVQTVNLGSSFNVFEESKSSEEIKEEPLKILQNGNGQCHLNNEKICVKCGSLFIMEKINDNVEKNVGEKKTRCEKIIYLFGLDLLRDWIFVNITMGMSVAIFAETNFSTLLPIILKEMQLTTTEISIVMSLLGTMDLLLRGISPFIGHQLRKSPRTMYLFSLSFLIIGRTLLMFTTGFISVLMVMIWMGFAKGIRAVYSVLVIPNYVPLERLPSASSLQQIVVGFLSMGAGPIIGYIRDSTGSYGLGIAFINCMTGLTIIMWMMEMFLVPSKNKTQPNR